MKKLALLFGLLFAFPAFAADNAVIVTPGVGVTMRSKDIGSGVQSMIHMLGDASGVSIYGTAGTANANILTVQGIASMTPLLATVTGTVAATQSGTWNITNVSGTVSLPTGAATAANQSTEIGSLATIATNSALPLPAQGNFTTNIGSVTSSDANSNAVLNDPCQTAVKAYTPINVVTATNTIITGVSAKKKYICGIFLYPAGTTNVAIFQATTATACATALVSVIGGTTTATGIIMTAQAGFVLGTGASSVAATTVNQTDLCIVTSAAVQVSGVVVTVDR